MNVARGKQEEFAWAEYAIDDFLPAGWADQITTFAVQNCIGRVLTSGSVTSREKTGDTKIPVLTVGGRKVRAALPWLFDLYRGTFRDIGQDLVGERLSIAEDDRYAVNLNVQRPGMRYECHIDSNPMEGLLYVTSHDVGEGGELVVSNDQSARGTDEIATDCVRIYPKRGTLVFFDARRFPHYVAPLARPNSIRIAVAMNYYVPSCPESARPKDLNCHLFGCD